MSDFGNLAVGLVMAGSFAIGATRRLLERRRARHELESRPDLADLGDPEEGSIVRVPGTVRARQPREEGPHPAVLVAPISGKPWVVYRARVTSSGSLVRGAAKPRESFAMVPFVLERDDGDAVAIEGAHALLDLPDTLSGPKTADDRDRRAKFLLLHGLSTSAGGVYDEVVVEAGMRVAVAGIVMKDVGSLPDGEAGYRDDAKPTLRLAGDLAHPLVIGAPDLRP
ncbi:hypothetical protein BH11MYX1_BH11MYX1_14000 [soil metagenome]